MIHIYIPKKCAHPCVLGYGIEALNLDQQKHDSSKTEVQQIPGRWKNSPCIFVRIEALMQIHKNPYKQDM